MKFPISLLRAIYISLFCLTSLINTQAFADESVIKKEQSVSTPSKSAPHVPSFEEEVKEDASEMFSPSYEGTFIKMMLALAGIVIFLFLAAWSLRKLSHSKMIQNNFAKKIKILEKRPLSPKSVLYLIEVNGKEILVSESQLEVRSLSVTDEKLSHE